MANINNFANDILLDFLDAFHRQLKVRLTEEFGDDWFEKGVERHLAKGYFDRTRAMLEAPMRSIDMGKLDEELYGVEHIWNIVNGNWKLFQDDLDSRIRTEVYLSEIAEMRHNVSHRRPHHYVRRAEVSRLAQNCFMILRALGASEADHFAAISERVGDADPPWGLPLGGRLPPEDEIVTNYIERSVQRSLHEWFATDSRQLVLWGDGGTGKSAAAYRFAKDIREAAPDGFLSACWITAKRIEFVDGAEKAKQPDFVDVPSVTRALLTALYDSEPAESPDDTSELLAELIATPSLVIIDDIDTVLDNDELSNFLLYELRNTKSKFLYTSRSKIPGLTTVEIAGFSQDELTRFVRSRVSVYGLSRDLLEKRIASIASVTSSYPLFVDDLLRFAAIVGLDDALSAWSQRKGDAAREYALRRQMESRRSAARDAIISIAVADRPLTLLEIATVAGRADDDVELAASDLLKWKLISQVAIDEVRPSYTMNNNTRRLVQRTYGRQPDWERFKEAFLAQSGEPMPAAKRYAIGSAISLARSLVIRGDVDEALKTLRDSMTGELAHSADLHGALGWVYTRPGVMDRDAARVAFKRAHELGARKEDTYYHWAQMEKDSALEISASDASEGLKAWQRCYEVAELGIGRIGASQQLCYLVGNARLRYGRLLEGAAEFARARGFYGHALASFRQSIKAPPSPARDVPISQRFKSLVQTLEALEDTKELQTALVDWEHEVPGDYDLQLERDRLRRRFPSLTNPAD